MPRATPASGSAALQENAPTSDRPLLSSKATFSSLFNPQNLYTKPCMELQDPDTCKTLKHLNWNRN